MRRGCIPGCLSGCFTSSIFLLLGAVVIYGVAALTAPWAFHNGGRRTPLLTWFGSGTLQTSGGAYPVFLFFFPSPHGGTLRLDGLRATGGIQGSGCLCISRETYQNLNIRGTIYGGFRSTQDALFEFRIHEPDFMDFGQRQHPGYFDLIGRFQGADLTMNDRGSYASTFHSGLRIEHASVRLHRDSFWSCKSACASATPPPH
jgi:hypothetical protein